MDVRVKVQAQKNYASLTQKLLWPYWILPHSARPYEFTPLNWFATLGSFLFIFYLQQYCVSHSHDKRHGGACIFKKNKLFEIASRDNFLVCFLDWDDKNKVPLPPPEIALV